MLYITTKDKNNVNTAYKALHNDMAEDGSNFLPFHLPCFSSDEIRKFRQKAFGQIIAEVINLFFSTNLTAWDVDFTLGRNITKMKSLSGKVFITELWHNAGGKYDFLLESLYRKVCDKEDGCKPTLWFSIAVRIAIIFAVYATSDADGEFSKTFNLDYCVPATDDLVAASAIVYARRMGLPVNNIICVCEENSAVWEFLYRGICQRKSGFPKAFECFIYAILGYEGVQEFLKCKDGVGSAVLSEELLEKLHEGIYAPTVGQQRIESVIIGGYRTNRYIFTSNGAMLFGGLQDYRASTGESRGAVIMVDTSPLGEEKHILSVLGITKKELSDLI